MSATSTSTAPLHHQQTQKTSNPKLQQTTYNNQQQQQHPDITKEEFERISEALKKEEFRKLFLDYIEEIQDPENRKRYEEEIKQIEAERGVDVVFIHPEPGFVIKTSQDGSQKCFINCAKSEHVAKPTNQICLDPKTGTRGLSWSIPMAQAPPRDDLDNNKKRCRVYDVVFHPDALYLAERNTSFHKCLVDTALDAVEREYKVTLDRINIKFPKLQFKGIARPTVIRKLAKDPPAECEEPHPLENIYPAKPSDNAGIPKVLPMKTIDCSKTATAATKQSSDYCTPKYTIKHRHDVDLTEYTHELDAKLHVSTPRELVVDIELPLLNSSNECQLDVTEKTVFLLSERAGARYRLNIDLPFKVNDKEGSAKFDVDTRHLVITLPVIRASIEKQRRMHESLLHLSREDSGVESDMRDELLSSNSESPVEEIISTTMEQILNKASEDINPIQEAYDTKSEDFLQSNIDYQLPAKFDCNVLDNTMSYVLHVRNVQEDSLQIKRADNELHLKFISLGSGYYPTHYSFYIQLPNQEKEAKILQADAEAWENNVVLNVHLNTSAESVSSYLAGLDSDHLQEHVLQQKLKVAHKSRQRQKEQQPSLDISIERSECEKTVEIEIKSRPGEMSTCNANTTEDEEDANANGSGEASASNQTNQKKVNKKQKRKNKKRRSLSESACDDIKAYQQQQQQLQQNSIPTAVPEVNETERDENAEDADDDEEDSSPERTEKTAKSMHATSLSMNVPLASSNDNSGLTQQRKHRSFSESRDSAVSFSAGSSSYKGILKHYSRYEPRPSISDSCDSIDEYSSSAYSTSVDGMTSAFNSLRFSQSFSDIPEENVVGLSESCKKTVRFSEVIKKQVFRLDSSILGQRKKNQKRRDRKQRALQRRLSEGDSADYEDNKPMAPLPASTPNAQYLKSKNNQQNVANNCKNVNNNKHNKTADKKSNKLRARLESESSSDVDNHKNSMMFEMDM
ncbi:protein kintoun [Lucilia sericata]|uniref:protein kintoun n=1 Tax=Lucilia sericata TaxID=13632 RepID=UPI0018A80B0F|nr:protein kintoun [Lucilia sericata]XP_037809943.1 protein kintoun [Lucilia sericata]